MIEGIPRISVRVITYNQEALIKRAIDSLLVQKDYIYEICVSDDCSHDGTWDVLQQYSKENPGLFNLHRNDNNLGIFANIEMSWTLPTGDLVYSLAGDDMAGDGWFKKVVEFILDKGIDYKNDLFCVYGDYKAVYPNGDSYIHSNKHILSGIDPVKLSIRGLIGNRSACYSKKVQDLYQRVSQGRSYIAEASIDRQLQVFAKDNYYISFIGNVYFAQVGVSMNIKGERHEPHLARWDYLLHNLKKWGVSLDKFDLNYVSFRKAKETTDYLGIFKNALTSIDFSLSMRGLQIRRLMFAVLRRLPHKTPIVDFEV